jgi:hypothetical protein
MNEKRIGIKEIRRIVLILLILDATFLILYVIFINIRFRDFLFNIGVISVVNMAIILYSYMIIVRKARNIDVSLYPGKGTESDPIQIDSKTLFPRDPIFHGSKSLHIVLNQLELPILGIYHCKKIEIRNCSFKDLFIENSEDISINGSTVSDLLYAKNCNNLLIDSTKIGILSLYGNKESIFKNNQIDNLEKNTKEKSKFNNVYKDNKISHSVLK